MKKVPLIAGNWKMNHSPKSAQVFLDFLKTKKELASGASWTNSILFVPAYCLTTELIRQAHELGVQWGAQNCHSASKGAFTGELSPQVLKELGIQSVLLGHSERRHLFGESPSLVAQRCAGALTEGLRPMLCLGETLEERQQNRTEQTLQEQLKPLIDVLLNDEILKKNKTQDGSIIDVAYEPVWAIGTGLTASRDQIHETHSFLKQIFQRKALPVGRLLYGGSVNSQNIDQLLALDSVDGVLVGGASVSHESWLQLLNFHHN